MELTDIFAAAKAATASVASLSDAERNSIIRQVADALDASHDAMLAANSADLATMSPDNPLYDRLMLTPERLTAIASDMRNVASLTTPVGEVLESRTLPNGIELSRITVPFGVVGVVYEARPNVTFDVFALCFKTGNVVILKGGKDADHSNRAAAALIRSVLAVNNIDPNAVTLLPATHEAVGALLDARGMVDIVIPRGGRRLIDFVRDTARVPVIETGAGVVHTYIHASADPEMARRIVENGKLRRLSVCNALDTVLFDANFPETRLILQSLIDQGVTVHADKAVAALMGDNEKVIAADDDTWDTEWMSKNIGARIVSGPAEAIEHIAQHGSGHSESIVAEDAETAASFLNAVDAACVYHNLPTSFTDGGQFGLGAEIGISTQKLGPRGPMGLSALTTYKWVLRGKGQTRP